MAEYLISILCHNRLPKTKACLEAVLAHTPSDPETVEIVVTDNASSDGTAQWLDDLANLTPNLRVIHHAENKGIAEGKNYVFDRCTAPYFVTLDNDALVGSGWLEGLRSGFDEHGVVQVGRANACGQITTDGYGCGGTEKPEYIDGSCFMVRTDIARSVGLCSSVFYGLFGCEDADFSLRLRLRGHKLAVRPIDVHHVNEPSNNGHGVTTDLTPAMNLAHARLRDRWGYYLKHRQFNARVCIRRSGSIGDVILASPLPRLIHDAWPEARIFIATDHPEVFAGNKHVEAVIPPNQAGSCDYLYDLDSYYEGQPQMSIWNAYVQRINTDSIVTIDAARRVPEIAQQEIVPGLPTEPFVALHLQPTAWPGRNVPARLWAGIANEVRKKGFRPVSVGMPAAPMDADLNLNSLTLAQLAYVVDKSAGFVGIDSAPFHVAQAYEKPSVVFFGSINPDYRCLHNTIAVVQQEHLDCLGCHHRQAPPRFEWCGCERGDVACMETLEIGRIRSALGRIFVVSETSKVRERARKYLDPKLVGFDVGCGGYEKVIPEAVSIDREGADVNMDLNQPLPFAAGSVDWIWSSHCLEHLIDYRAVLADWWSKLKPGGILGLYLPHRDYYDNAWNADHKHAFDQDAIAGPLVELGAEILENALDVDDVPLSARPDRHYQTERYSFLVIARKP